MCLVHYNNQAVYNVLTLQLQIAFDNAYRPIGSMSSFFGLISVSYEISLYLEAK